MQQSSLIELNPEEIEDLILRIENQTFRPDDFPLLVDFVRAMVYLEGAFGEKSLGIQRLKDVFSIKTESARKLKKFLQRKNRSSS